jgi:quaternary ammonium compound-resistance protein SugE
MLRAWGLLFMAGIFEIGFAFFLKESRGFQKLWPSIGVVGCSGLSLLFLSKSLKHLPLTVSYPVWVSLGIVGTSILGMLHFHERLAWDRLVLVLIILVATAMLSASR